MESIRWSKKAIKEIDRIAEYISKDSIHHATNLVQRIFNLEELIAKQPLAGRIVPEYQEPNLRELIMGSYRIIYKIISEDKIVIVTVHHGARLLKDI